MRRARRLTRWLLSPVIIVAILVTVALAGNTTPVPAVGLYFLFDGDPTAGTGACNAPQWQLLFRTDNDTLYYKSGTACTAWTPFNASGGGHVTSISASTGITLTPNPITATGTVAIANTTVAAGHYTYASVTFNAQGQATAASSGTAPGAIASTTDLLRGDGAGNAVAYGGSTATACGPGFVVTDVAANAAGVIATVCTPIGTAGGVVVTNANAGTITIAQAVYQTSTASNVNLAQANSGSTSQVVGLVLSASIATTASGTMQIAGPFTATTAQWDAVVTGESGGLTAGTSYWLDPATPGNLTATPPSTPTQFDTYVGIAQSTTVMILGLAQPIGV